MKRIFTVLVLALPMISFGQSVVEELSDQIRWMESGDTIELHYSFVGCFGPYHHGVVTLHANQETIAFHSESLDEQGKDPISEAGTIAPKDLLRALNEAHRTESSEVLGNVIDFEIVRKDHLLAKGTDRITQKHFIEVFHPYTSAIKTTSEFLIPKVSSGGFVK